jgi:hypothetical protein
MTEILSPTRERLAKDEPGAWRMPEVSQQAVRRYYRKISEATRLFEAGSIEWSHHRAAEKLATHWQGQLGINVGSGEGSANDAVDYPQTYHGQMVAKAKAACSDRQWRALVILTEETGSVEAIGGAICQRKNPVQARAAGLELLINGLDALAKLWGFDQP